MMIFLDVSFKSERMLRLMRQIFEGLFPFNYPNFLCSLYLEKPNNLELFILDFVKLTLT